MKKTEIKWANIPDAKFENDPPPPDESDRAPGSAYDRLRKRIEAREKEAAERKRPGENRD